MLEGDRIAEKSPVLCLQLSSAVPKNKASLHSRNSFQSLLPYNLYLQLQFLQPVLPCSFTFTAASLPLHTKGAKWLHSMPQPLLQRLPTSMSPGWNYSRAPPEYMEAEFHQGDQGNDLIILVRDWF